MQHLRELRRAEEHIIRRLFRSHDGFETTEEAALNRLAAANSYAAGQDIKSPAGLDSYSKYLAQLETTAIELSIQPASRDYRADFPHNYRSRFPTEARSYRAYILEASLEHYNGIWVNGEKFEFTAEAIRRAENLQAAWTDLGTVLERWSYSIVRVSSPGSVKPSHAEILSALSTLDCVWASFEERYISELVEIETKARSHIIEAIKLERRLRHLEKEHGKDFWELSSCQEVQRCLVAVITRLNSVANVNGKGRDDLRAEVLTEAYSILRQRQREHEENPGAVITAEILATDVVESFNAMRGYLRQVAKCLERVDAHLGNNSGLVARLVDWEASFEVGTAYLQSRQALQALCDAVAQIHHVQTIAPKLKDMCDECDVELFMVLPRLIWLRFLGEPWQQMPLLVRLLPHRFVAASGTDPIMGAELQSFIGRYNEVEQTLCHMWQRQESPLTQNDVKSLLANMVVNGKDDDVLYDGVRPEHINAVKVLVGDLMHELEGWSMELQRHCPEDWNQYTSLLVHCLTAREEKDRAAPFGV